MNDGVPAEVKTSDEDGVRELTWLKWLKDHPGINRLHNAKAIVKIPDRLILIFHTNSRPCA